MELSVETLDGLQLAGDQAHIPDSCFENLLNRTCESVLDRQKRNAPVEDPTLLSVDRGALKQAHAALATLLLEAAKHDKDPATLGHVLEECKLSADRIATFNNIYQDNKQSLQILLSSIGNNPPHIVDVDWRLDYYIKNNQLEKVNQPTYLISLQTEECGQPDPSQVQFSCSQDQLQDLVGKLKDVCKSLERTSQM